MEKRIRLNSYSVNVQLIQPALINRGTVCVFLHEALGSIIQWKQFPSIVCRELNLPGIVIERRGHGLSDPLDQTRTPSYLHDYTDELHRILQEVFSVETTFLLIGHSDGASIALIYASRYAKSVKALISIAAHTFVEEETIAGIPPAVEAFESGKLDGLKRIHGEKTNTLFYAWSTIWQSADFRGWDIRHEIRNIQCPVLALQGENDQYGTTKQIQSIHDNVTDVTSAILSDCGHHPQLEKQAETVQFIADFARRKIAVTA